MEVGGGRTDGGFIFGGGFLGGVIRGGGAFLGGAIRGGAIRTGGFFGDDGDEEDEGEAAALRCEAACEAAEGDAPDAEEEPAAIDLLFRRSAVFSFILRRRSSFLSLCARAED